MIEIFTGLSARSRLTRRYAGPLAVVVIGGLLAGCAPEPYGVAPEGDQGSAASIELLKERPIDRDFEELDRLQFTGSREEGILYLKRRTRSLGGDAVVLTKVTDQGVEHYWEGWTAFTVPIKRLQGVAIRYL